MAYPRSSLVSVADTHYYHCISRCVRRAALCGDDPLTGKSFTHRRQWLLDRLGLLTEVFAIDLCAYAILSNHYHLVVRIDAERAQAWSDEQVIERWTRLFAEPAFMCARHQPGWAAAQQISLEALVARWRARLFDLSWFMRCLNEPIARAANQEDECTGRFWEGRFKCQALLDTGALLTAMVYVDLNPVRAGLASGLEDSDFTSVQARLFEITGGGESACGKARLQLLPFVGAERSDATSLLPFNLQDYLDLVDGSGRAVRAGRTGFIAETRLQILKVIGIEPREWLGTVTDLQKRFEIVLGAPHRLRSFAERHGRRWHRGQRAARRLYALTTA